MTGVIIRYIIVFLIVVAIFLFKKPKKKLKPRQKSKVIKDDKALIKGKKGEEEISKILRGVEGVSVLNNLYIPTDYGYSEIDVLGIKGNILFVIESKNYYCRIIGTDNDLKWKAKYSDGREYDLYNPINQNDTHIKALKSVLNNGRAYRVKSVVVFSDTADITSVKNNRNDVIFCNTRDLKRSIEKELVGFKGDNKLTDKIVNSLEKYANVSNKIKEEHIRNIQKYKK